MTAIGGRVPTRAHRYTIAARTEARRLARAGWNDSEIIRMLHEDGFTEQPVSKVHIGVWVRPQRARKASEDQDLKHAQESAERGARPMGRHNVRPEYKLARMRALHAVGLSYTDIARMMGFDFGDRMSRDAVRDALALGRYPQVRNRRGAKS